MSRRGRASRRAAGAESRKIQINRKIKRARGTTRTAGEMLRGQTRDVKETGQKTETETKTRTRAGIERKTRPERRNGRRRRKRRRTASGTRREKEIKRGIRKGNGSLTKTENETRREIASVRKDGREKKEKNDTERLTRS